ncbi:TonB-dependent siderophore receptor [Sphingomonas bacterium]|uniref:TonB-dependent siderophore receptor n=1 Tax=Sphingomonas bacterium TaxID=1895847 RepID=UPI002604765E|nr:TonB-dependent siderophore receptor [Sphingomonas bacterium]
MALATALAISIPGIASAQTAPTVPPPAAPSDQQTDTPTAAPADNQDQAGDIVITGRFVQTGAKSAMKQDIRALDTPFTTSSYSGAFVKSLETASVSDLYNYMTGVKKSGNTGYDVTLRGFKSSGDDRNAIMVDGLPGLTGRYGSPPTVNVDHIDLVKGPMSVLYGQIQPGGFINIITKKPQKTFAFEADLRLNTFASKYRSTFDRNGVTGDIDITGPIDSDGILSFRLVGEVANNKGFRDYASNQQQLLSPSLMLDLGATKLTAQFEYRHVREHFDVGLVAPPNAANTVYDINAVAPITTTYQQPTDFRFETGKAVNVFLVQDLGGGWKFNASYRHVSYNSDQQETSNTGIQVLTGAAAIASFGQFRVQRRFRDLETNRQYDYLDTNVTGKFSIGGIENNVLLGYNVGADLVNENRHKFFNSSVRNATTGACPVGGTCLDIGLYNPDYTGFPAFNSTPAVNSTLANQQVLLTNRFVRSHNYGIYVSDLITFAPWLKVSIGGRKFSETSAVEADNRNAPGVIKRKTDKRNFLPSAGLLIEPTRKITIYGSYAQSYVPVDPAAFGEDGQNNFTPITGKQYEAGVKVEDLFGGILSGTAAIYRIDQIGQITQNPCPAGVIAQGTCSYQLGKGRSDGFEIEGNLRPVKNWQIIAGYAHITAKVLTAATAASSFQIGRRLPNVASNAANLWTRYDWSNGLGVGLGVTYTGDREGLLPTSATDLKTLDLPAYAIVDAGFYFNKPHYSLTLKVGNLLDKKYYESAGATGRIQIAPGQPRYMTLTGRVKF